MDENFEQEHIIYEIPGKNLTELILRKLSDFPIDGKEYEDILDQDLYKGLERLCDISLITLVRLIGEAAFHVLLGKLKGANKYRKWTKEENDMLEAALRYEPSIVNANWKRVAFWVNSRTPEACRKRAYLMYAVPLNAVGP